jgi:pimeloyl-ACP methyl ester carboxylesterase
MTHVSPFQRGSLFRRIVSSALSWLVLALAVILGAAGAIAALFGAALLFNTISVLFVIGLSAGFLITCGGAWMAARMMRRARPGRIALGTGAATMLLVALVSSVTILRPLPSTPAARQAPSVPASVGYWDVGPGSRIAYLKVPAQGMAKATPIIMVGGGPGEEDVADTSQTQFFEQLALLGYDVYFYDQIGSGLSSRLDNPAQYTLARHIADLEAIRARIGAQQVILMGASWGGTLVANYMAAYPQSVAKAVLTSPAPIDYAEWPDFGSVTCLLPAETQRQANQMFRTPRFIFWYLLGEVNPKAAHNLVSDREADAFFNTFLQLVFPGTVCNPAHAPKGLQLGNGFYDNVFTTRDASTQHGKVNPRELLAANHTPALILTGSCNYIKWAPTWQYKTTLPDSSLLYFPHAGHEIYLDQPELYLASLRVFLLGTPLPLQPWTTPQPPDSLACPLAR